MLTSILYAIFMPTWLDFVVILAVLGGSGGILGRLGRVLARIGGLLGRLWPVLKASWRLGASWVRLGASLARPPAFGRRLARKTSQHKPVLASEREAR